MNRTSRIATLVAAVLVVVGAAGLQALLQETAETLRCSEGSQLKLPRRMTIFQVINDDSFSTADTVSIFFESGYLFRNDVNPGKVIVKGTLIKSDGSEVKLPKLARNVQFCCASLAKQTDFSFEPGDWIEWKTIIKGHSPLLAGVDCWSLTVGVGVDE